MGQVQAHHQRAAPVGDDQLGVGEREPRARPGEVDAGRRQAVPRRLVRAVGAERVRLEDHLHGAPVRARVGQRLDRVVVGEQVHLHRDRPLRAANERQHRRGAAVGLDEQRRGARRRGGRGARRVGRRGDASAREREQRRREQERAGGRATRKVGPLPNPLPQTGGGRPAIIAARHAPVRRRDAVQRRLRGNSLQLEHRHSRAERVPHEDRQPARPWR